MTNKKPSKKKVEPQKEKLPYVKQPEASQLRPIDIKSQMEQLTANQIDVLKMMNEFNSRLAVSELENQKLYHVLAMMTKNQDEFRGILDMLGRGMRQLKKQLEEGDEEFMGGQEEQSGNQKKDPPIHDDVTSTCTVCDKVYNSRLEKCPRCGFIDKNKKKGR